ncbi:hypothetical protein ACFWPV_10220 [Streptomyces uncialis]|uniref:hypothetical protein n=1 Tax=Streptomyces uncialis TaxID=1048205 RepID=UPI003663F78A
MAGRRIPADRLNELRTFAAKGSTRVAREIGALVAEIDALAAENAGLRQGAEARRKSCPLGPLDLVVLAGVVNGENLIETAERIGARYEQVKSRRRAIYRRIGARGASHAAAIAVHNRWAKPADGAALGAPERTDDEALRASLVASPGEWALVKESNSRSSAGQLARNIRAGRGPWGPPYTYDAEARTVHGQPQVYARYVPAARRAADKRGD